MMENGIRAVSPGVVVVCAGVSVLGVLTLGWPVVVVVALALIALHWMSSSQSMTQPLQTTSPTNSKLTNFQNTRSLGHAGDTTATYIGSSYSGVAGRRSPSGSDLGSVNFGGSGIGRFSGSGSSLGSVSGSGSGLGSAIGSGSGIGRFTGKGSSPGSASGSGSSLGSASGNGSSPGSVSGSGSSLGSGSVTRRELDLEGPRGVGGGGFRKSPLSESGPFVVFRGTGGSPSQFSSKESPKYDGGKKNYDTGRLQQHQQMVQVQVNEQGHGYRSTDKGTLGTRTMENNTKLTRYGEDFLKFENQNYEYSQLSSSKKLSRSLSLEYLKPVETSPKTFNNGHHPDKENKELFKKPEDVEMRDSRILGKRNRTVTPVGSSKKNRVSASLEKKRFILSSIGEAELDRRVTPLLSSVLAEQQKNSPSPVATKTIPSPKEILSQSLPTPPSPPIYLVNSYQAPPVFMGSISSPLLSSSTTYIPQTSPQYYPNPYESSSSIPIFNPNLQFPTFPVQISPPNRPFPIEQHGPTMPVMNSPFMSAGTSNPFQMPTTYSLPQQQFSPTQSQYPSIPSPTPIIHQPSPPLSLLSSGTPDIPQTQPVTTHQTISSTFAIPLPQPQQGPVLNTQPVQTQTLTEKVERRDAALSNSNSKSDAEKVLNSGTLAPKKRSSCVSKVQFSPLFKKPQTSAESSPTKADLPPTTSALAPTPFSPKIVLKPIPPPLFLNAQNRSPLQSPKFKTTPAPPTKSRKKPPSDLIASRSKRVARNIEEEGFKENVAIFNNQ